MSYFDDNEDYIVYGKQCRPKHDATCNRCGETGLKWRCTDDGWRLFEDERVEHNRLKEHKCDETTSDDFEVIA